MLGASIAHGPGQVDCSFLPYSTTNATMATSSDVSQGRVGVVDFGLGNSELTWRGVMGERVADKIRRSLPAGKKVRTSRPLVRQLDQFFLLSSALSFYLLSRLFTDHFRTRKVGV